jgi:hypothetical protein
VDNVVPLPSGFVKEVPHTLPTSRQVTPYRYT